MPPKISRSRRTTLIAESRSASGAASSTYVPGRSGAGAASTANSRPSRSVRPRHERVGAGRLEQDRVARKLGRRLVRVRDEHERVVAEPLEDGDARVEPVLEEVRNLWELVSVDCC